MKAIMYLAPRAPARHSYRFTPYTAGDKPEPITRTYTSTKPGFLHVTLADGTALTVETGKGYLLGVTEVEGKQ